MPLSGFTLIPPTFRSFSSPSTTADPVVHIRDPSAKNQIADTHPKNYAYRKHCHCLKILAPFSQYLAKVDLATERAAAMLAAARKDLQKKGHVEEASAITAVWDVCFGGCGFDLDARESTLACEVAKFLFSSPPSVEIIIKSAASKITDPLIREEVRKISKNFTRKPSAASPKISP